MTGPRRQADRDLQARVKHLLQALKTYGQHVIGCRAKDARHDDPDCSCGLREAVKAGERKK